jgi:hypothetical protein
MGLGLLRKIQRGFRDAGKGLRNFGNSVESGFNKGVRFVEKKALPLVEKVAGGISKGLSYATPVLGMIAPELLPIALGANALAKTIKSGAHSGIQAIESGRKIVKEVQQPIMKSAVYTNPFRMGMAAPV